MNSFCKITALLIVIPLFSCSTGKNAAVEKQDNTASVSSASGSEENILPAESSGTDSKENISQSETSDSGYGEKTAAPEINRSEIFNSFEPSKTPETYIDSASSGSPAVPEADKEAEALKASGTEGTALDVSGADKDSEKVKAPAASEPDGRALKEQLNPAREQKPSG